MELLKKKILSDGKVINENVLKVDNFLNHQVDVNLMKEIGKTFAGYFSNKNVSKIFTIESSGIAPATMVALELNVPLVVLKKQTSKILSEDFYQTEVKSFTKGNFYNLTVSKQYISKDDNVLIVDDFLAYGEASLGAINLVKQGLGNIVGLGIIIEKSFQPGRKKLEELNLDVYSLARIKNMSNGIVEFI